MKLKLFLLCLVIVLSSCDEDNENEQSDTNITKFGVIEGQILDGVSKSPLSNVLISTYPPTTSILTDAEGKYKIENVKEDNYDIFLQRTGYKDAQASIYVVGNKSNKANIFMFDKEYLNHAPNIPEFIFPIENNQSIPSKNIALRWNASDPDNDRLKYNLYLDTNSSEIGLFASNLSKRELLIDSLEKDKEYYLFLESIDPFGLTAKSEVITIRTDIKQSSKIPNSLVFNLNESKVVTYNGLIQDYNAQNITFSTNRFGEFNSSIYFNGDSYISMNDLYNTNQYISFSISLWVRLLNGELGKFQNGYTDLFGRLGGVGVNKSSWGVIIDEKARLGFATHDGNQFSYLFIDDVLPREEWFNISIVYTSQSVKFYLNGINVSVQNCVIPQNTNNPFVVGARHNTPSRFKGYLDDIYFIEGELTDEEILELIEQ